MLSQDQEEGARKLQGVQYKEKDLLVWEGKGRWPAVKVYLLNPDKKKG